MLVVLSRQTLFPQNSLQLVKVNCCISRAAKKTTALFPDLSLSHTNHFPPTKTNRYCSGSGRLFVAKTDQQKLESILFSSENMEVIHLHQTVESTQEEAKRIIGEQMSKVDPSSIPAMIAVLADGQSKGRGTSGRSWVTTKGNLFLTCAFPMDQIPLSKITMLPLGCGIVIADTLTLHSRSKPTLKWPNDVLLDGLKVAGTLIENWTIQNHTWWLVGIGVNVESHPQDLVKENDDALAIPRSAASLRLYAANENIPKAPELGISIACSLLEFVQTIQTSSTSSIVQRWKSFAQLNVPYTIRNTGEVVQVKDIESDGRLRVLGSDGQERLLSTDYFY